MNPYAEQPEQDDREREEVSDELNRLMATQWGRSFVWRLLGRTGMYRQSFTGVAANTDFNEGRRSIGLQLTTELTEFCIEQYTRMFSENSGK